MKEIKLGNAEAITKNESCKTLEYSFGDKDIDLGVATITGRFPESGFCKNTISKELIYVMEGSAKIYFRDKTVELDVGDAVLIDVLDEYYWETDYCKVSMSCSPAWSPEQHVLIPE